VKAEEIVKDLNIVFKNSRYLTVSETWNIPDCLLLGYGKYCTLYCTQCGKTDINSCIISVLILKLKW
jgi:hypothetical protein